MLLNPGDLREDGSKDDIHFGEIMNEALKQYRDRLLPPHMDEPFEKLREGVEKVVKQGQLLEAKALPVLPKHGPRFIVCATFRIHVTLLLTQSPPSSKDADVVQVPKDAEDALAEGTQLSFRFSLHSDASGPELFSSPWSDFVRYDNGGKIRPMYIGDGFAAMDTTRKLYCRTSVTDLVGKLVATIRGRGIMTWPEEVQSGSI